ncbi:hypothetical protein FA95DRAFT_1597745 [Auriscalpium vulgare]|uniref:Uncharacterized protein n=1 Tax=Auriscalpium vulgare TaxID=40419 RepID=A0ACB8RI73_9AGAM|nr:hypothetical protein FA95DRAFT_1597745 [Auriscalpium vulgare]
MFKRVERRRKRKEEEEELGLDEDMKAVMGLQDTDSSESESDSDSDSSSEAESSSSVGPAKRAPQGGKKRKRVEEAKAEADDASSSDGEEEAEDNVDGEEKEDEEEEEEEEGDSDDEQATGEPAITVSSALRQPIRESIVHPDQSFCAMCPGKILKNSTMVQVHESSKAHQRRFKRVRELAMKVEPDEEIIQTLVVKIEEETKPILPAAPQAVAVSRRAQKRKEKLAHIKVVREQNAAKKAKAKEIGRAKQTAKKEAAKAEELRRLNALGNPLPVDTKPTRVKREPKTAEQREEAREKKRRKLEKQGKTPPKPHNQKRYFDETASGGGVKKMPSKGTLSTKARKEKKRTEGEKVLQVFD